MLESTGKNTSYLSEPVLVTGATGNAGREVVGELRRRGIPCRLGVTDVTVDSDAVHLDFNSSDTFDSAVRGCRAVFLLRPPPISDTQRTLNVFVDTARRNGVSQVVFLSVAGAANNRWVPHYAVEKHLESGPDHWTILRPGFFSQNLSSAYLQDIVTNNQIFVPAGMGRIAFVDLRDVASVAVDALLEPEQHSRAAYTLTGPSAHTFHEVAAFLTRATEREIGYHPASILGYVQHLRKAGLKWGHCLVQTVLHVGLRRGQAEQVDHTLRNLLGREPIAVEQFVSDHAEVWRWDSNGH